MKGIQKIKTILQEKKIPLQIRLNKPASLILHELRKSAQLYFYVDLHLYNTTAPQNEDKYILKYTKVCAFWVGSSIKLKNPF